MILADKIITLRKKAGWSQEELASQLGVTRQSVSKWEGAQSVPDLDKVVQMSRLFGVSTDYLLKDELEEEEFVESEADETPLRRVTMEQAARYLALRKACAPRIALAVAMCIISPVVIIFLSAMADAGLGGISEDLAAGLGVSVILVLVAIAVGMFLSCGAKTKEFDFLEKEPFETEYGVSGMVRERRKAYEPTASRCTILGVVLCILAVVPLMLGVGLASSDVAATMAPSGPSFPPRTPMSPRCSRASLRRMFTPRRRWMRCCFWSPAAWACSSGAEHTPARWTSCSRRATTRAKRRRAAA